MPSPQIADPKNIPHRLRPPMKPLDKELRADLVCAHALQLVSGIKKQGLQQLVPFLSI